MTDLIHRPGFLGTDANLATDSALVLLALIAATFTIGFWLARQGRYQAHKWFQTTGGALTLGLVLWLMILPYRDFILPAVPQELDRPFIWLTTLHGLLGAIALPFGLFVILRGHNLVPAALQFNDYKKFMRWSYALFILTIALGFGVYIVWFVTNPNPPTF